MHALILTARDAQFSAIISPGALAALSRVIFLVTFLDMLQHIVD